MGGEIKWKDKGLIQWMTCRTCAQLVWDHFLLVSAGPTSLHIDSFPQIPPSALTKPTKLVCPDITAEWIPALKLDLKCPSIVNHYSHYSRKPCKKFKTLCYSRMLLKFHYIQSAFQVKD